MKLLVVDDETTLLKAWSYAGRHLGWQVAGVERGRDAVALAETFQPDGIVLDVGLPDASGVDLLATMRRSPKLQNIPIFVISGQVDEELKKVCFFLGAKEVTQKPFDFLAELRLIQRWSDHAPPVPV